MVGKRKLILKISIFSISFLFVCFVFSYWANYKIIHTVQPFLVEQPDSLPSVKTGLLLGTSKLLKNGYINIYFKYRIEATLELFKSGKIKYIIISGDNGRKEYNEPEDMKIALVNAGIPDSAIYLDYAGFRTFDSVIRCKEIFGQDQIIVISQKFHNERAVFIARKNNIIAYGFNAKDVSKSFGFKTRVREFFAKAKVFIDMAIGKEPKFLGEKIKIGK